MVTTELGACEQFIFELRRKQFDRARQLDQVIEDFLRRHPRADPAILVDHLVGQNVLTSFRPTASMQGKTQGLVLGPYVLTDSVGQGSMGPFTKPFSKNDNKNVRREGIAAAKHVERSPGPAAGAVVRQFSHPTVVPFVDVGTSGGLHYLVWAYVEGESLDAVVQRSGRLDAATTAAIGLQVPPA